MKMYKTNIVIRSVIQQLLFELLTDIRKGVDNNQPEFLAIGEDFTIWQYDELENWLLNFKYHNVINKPCIRDYPSSNTLAKFIKSINKDAEMFRLNCHLSTGLLSGLNYSYIGELNLTDAEIFDAMVDTYKWSIEFKNRLNYRYRLVFKGIQNYFIEYIRNNNDLDPVKIVHMIINKFEKDLYITGED